MRKFLIKEVNEDEEIHIHGTFPDWLSLNVIDEDELIKRLESLMGYAKPFTAIRSGDFIDIITAPAPAKPDIYVEGGDRYALDANDELVISLDGPDDRRYLQWCDEMPTNMNWPYDAWKDWFKRMPPRKE